MGTDTPVQHKAGMQRDWFRPIPVGRFAALLNPVPTDPFAALTSLGQLVWTDGTDVDPESTLPAWPDYVPAASTELHAGYDAHNLYLRIVCDEPCPNAVRSSEVELWRNDHVSIAIDPLHDHWRYMHLLVAQDGRSQTTWNTVHYGYIPADLVLNVTSDAKVPGVQISRSRQAWTVDVVVPWTSLEIPPPRPGQCLGLNVARWRTAGCEQLTQWSPTLGITHDARLFGDLYLGRPAAVLQEIRLGGPNWGCNRGYARFAASQPFNAWIEAGDSVQPADTKPARLEAGPYGLAGYHFDYQVDPRDILGGRLTLKWCAAGAAGTTLPGAGSGEVSQASFVFGWKRSVLLTHVAGRPDKPARPHDACAPDFFARMCEYLLARLPRFRRQREQYLVSDDGVRIDLLSDDPFLPMAQSIIERIEGQDDQLAASALVLCQPDVLISSGAMARTANGTNAASMLWTGGLFCDAYSLVVAALVDRLAALQGWRIPTGLFWLPTPPGTKFTWPNHWWGCGWLDRGPVLLDAELGRFFYRRDGKHLATVNDLFANPSLAESAGIGLGDYFRLCRPSDASMRHLPHWRDIRPLGS